MIENSNDIQEYENMNKLYIPNNYKNQNYTYKFNGDYILIITNNNCYQNYNTVYCDCISYNYKNNVLSEVYTCNTNNSNPTINYSYISSDINDSQYIKNRFTNDYLIYFLILIVGLLFAKWLTSERKVM